MRSRPAVLIDVARGEAQIGRRVVAVSAAGGRGELRIDENGAGVVLRPLSFGERGRILARALCAAQPLEETCAGILAASLVRAGESQSAVAEILALALAGAGEEAPPFAQTVSLVARATGWEFAQLADADALEIDRLAMQLAEQKSASDWNTLVLVSEPAVELMAIRGELAVNLLARAVAPWEDDPPASFERGEDAAAQPAREENEELHRAVAPSFTDAARPAAFAENHSPSASSHQASSPVPALEAASAFAPAASRELPAPRFRLRETRELGLAFSAASRPSAPLARGSPAPLISSPSPDSSEPADFVWNDPLEWPESRADVAPSPFLAAPRGSQLYRAPELAAIRAPAAAVETARPPSTHSISAPACELGDALAALLHEEANLRGIDR